MAKIIIDGSEIDVPADYTLLQACEQAGAEVPRFCYHERLSVAGNCRMCLVEVKGGPPKPTASCAMAVKDLRPGPNGEPPVVMTNSPMVKKAREGVMEFLLINHPLDCPICDQGGECDLQDQAMAFGGDHSRFAENKRAVEDKYIGALVKTTMTRCIQCTRCVRFSTEVAGVTDLGAIGRGEDMEITSYLEQAMTSELQGNIIDLCPVGALTSKPYAFTARPWELTKTESVDVMDAVGSAIRVDSRGREVMRILPRLNEAVNEEWISDKSRFIWDGLKAQRLDRPYVRNKGKLVASSWTDAFNTIAANLKGKKASSIGAIAGDLASLEDVYALQQLMGKLGSPNLDCRQDGAKIDPSMGRGAYIFNPGIVGIEEADVLLIVGSDPRKEAPVLNARIRKRWRTGALKVATIAAKADWTYDTLDLGNKPQLLADLVAGKGDFAQILKDAKHPLVIVGQAALQRDDAASIVAHAAELSQRDGWNGLAVLHTAASRVGALDLGFVPGEGGLSANKMAETSALDVLFLLGADEIEIGSGAFVVYIGSHGDKGAHRADVILPAAAYTEKSGLYVNTEGRVQRANRASFPPGDAREDWAILRALSEVLGKTLSFDSLSQLRAAMFAEHPHLAALDTVTAGDAAQMTALIGHKGAIAAEPFHQSVSDFYLTNPIARASAIMAECSALAANRLPMAAE
jgi:NADH-quinone oxidoreductase subunit G